MVRIKCYDISDDIFDTILKEQVENIKIVDSIDPYSGGYNNRSDIYYDGKEYLICLEHILNYYCDNCIPDCTEWKQCKVRRVENTDTLITKTIDGARAYYLLMELLHRYYNDEEIEECLHSHEAEKDDNYTQCHINVADEGYIQKYENCFYYDINGAHNDALIEIFPKAEHALTNLYISRHDNPNYKAIVNYGVGMLCKKGYRKTYNWIVQRTTKKLYEAMDYTDGIQIYANTDGFVVSSPKHELQTSSKLGEYKIEYFGDVYLYRDKNYWLLQMGDIMKGSCLTSVRKDIDLSKGQVVHYERRRLKLIEGKWVNIAENIEKENLFEPKKENLWEE